MTQQYCRSAESVTEGHPDKLADCIGGALLDHALRISERVKQHPRVALEVGVKGDTKKGGIVTVFGEVTLPTGVSFTEKDYKETITRVVTDIGYTDPRSGFCPEHMEYVFRITKQSKDIDHGVSRIQTGAGDQGKMIGGACTETPECLPLPIVLAHSLTDRLTVLRTTKTLPYLLPDGKAQVVVSYDRKNRPVSVISMTISTSHTPEIDQNELARDVKAYVIDPVIEQYGIALDNDAHIFINGAGPWTVYGPTADAGQINRKIVVDTYGGYFPIGGGGLHGKDPTKVDLSGHLAARFAAKQLVKEGLCTRAELEIVYTIGYPTPVAIRVDTYGTGKISDKKLSTRVCEYIDFSVDGMITALDLYRPVYTEAARKGFFGNEAFLWER